MFNGNALMGAVSHTFEISMGNSNYKDFEFGKLLMETWGKKKKERKTTRVSVKAREPSWQHIKKLSSPTTRGQK